MKDDYKKLSKEWGSKRRKQDSRAAKSTLKRPTKEDLEELEERDVKFKTWFKSIPDDAWEDVSLEEAFKAGYDAARRQSTIPFESNRGLTK